MKDPKHDCVSNLTQNALKIEKKKKKEMKSEESPCVHKFSSENK